MCVHERHIKISLFSCDSVWYTVRGVFQVGIFFPHPFAANVHRVKRCISIGKKIEGSGGGEKYSVGKSECVILQKKKGIL